MGIFSPSFLPTFMERHEKRPQTFVIIFVVEEGLPYMTSVSFWDFFTLSAKSIQFVRTFAAFLDPPPPSLRASYMEAHLAYSKCHCPMS